MKSAKRGEREVYNAADFAGNPLVFVKWKDNCEISIPAPAIVLQYNSSMSGRDVMDHAFSCNRPGITSKTWLFPLLTFCLQSSLYNFYLIYQKTLEAATAYLEFLHLVVQNYLVSYGKPAKIPRGQCFMVTREWKAEY